MPAGLWVVATPLGNLEDLSPRALQALSQAHAVLCEDTRRTSQLMSALGLSKRLERYDEHAAPRTRPKALAVLAAGGTIALVSDAGTPLVSDPGYRLVRDAVEAGAAVFPIPGASAALAGLTVAGLPTDRFLFAGFTPHKTQARQAFFAELAPIRASLARDFPQGWQVKADISVKPAAAPVDPTVCQQLFSLQQSGGIRITVAPRVGRLPSGSHAVQSDVLLARGVKNGLWGTRRVGHAQVLRH